VEHTVLDEDRSLSREMIEKDEIRTQVAVKTVDRLYANVDVEAAIAGGCLSRAGVGAGR
jgi:hypothetical protein